MSRSTTRPVWPFAVEHMLFGHGIVITDGTTGIQTVRDFHNVAYRRGSTNSPAFLMESQSQVSGIPRLGYFNDCYVAAGKSGGTGTWNVSISLGRAALNPTIKVLPNVAADDYNAAAVPQFHHIPSAIRDGDFLGGSPALNDVLRCKIQVTPGQAVAQAVSVLVIFVNNGAVPFNNVGNVLSQDRFYR